MTFPDVLYGPLYAAIATSSFAVLFGLHIADAILAAAGAGLGWAVLQNAPSAGSMAFQIFLAAFAAGIYSEIVGALRKRPATSYMIVSIIPLVPGSGMFYMMVASLEGDSARSVEVGLSTLMAAFSIALGLAIASSAGRIIIDRRRHFPLIKGKGS